MDVRPCLRAVFITVLKPIGHCFYNRDSKWTLCPHFRRLQPIFYGKRMIKRKKESIKPWHPAEESIELIYDVCQRFLNPGLGDGKTESVVEIAHWLAEKYNRPSLTREKIYPLFREAVKRNILILQPPLEVEWANRIKKIYNLEEDRFNLSIVNVTGPTAARNVTSKAADIVINLIDKVANEKREEAIRNHQDPDNISVHLGMGAGLATMIVARRLANRVATGDNIPKLVLHAISTGGFFVDQPHKAPVTYFAYFDDIQAQVECIALFAETVVQTGEYERIKKNTGLNYCFKRRNEIDIIVTSLASSTHVHGLLKKYLDWLIENKCEGLSQTVLDNMYEAGWVGDVQFRPYSKEGPLDDNICPVRAVTLFELDELVEMAKTPGKYIVLVGAPCGQCGDSKFDAIQPLLTNEKLHLWTHLVTDVDTANELMENQKDETQDEKNP